MTPGTAVYTGKYVLRLALSKRERTTPGANSQPSSGMVGEFTWTDEMPFPDHFSIYHAQNFLALMNQWMWTPKIQSKMKTDAVW
jgi:hypothetical protein